MANKKYPTAERIKVRFHGHAVTQADHVYPVVKGGETTISNLVTACSICNIKKGSKVAFGRDQLAHEFSLPGSS